MLSKEKQNQYLKSLLEFLKIPSISADSRFKKEMMAAANFLGKELKQAGFLEVNKLYAKGNSIKNSTPVVYAERIDNLRNTTVLIYGHYDVQPPDPIEEWKSKPFEPIIRENKIIARGATDDKGQIYTHIAALKHLSKEWGDRWPINIKLLIEGEEESGSLNIGKLISESPEKFRADVCLVSDTGFVSKNTPAIEVGLRGIVYFDLEIEANQSDLHSGLFGGAVFNPLNIISRILTKLEDRFSELELRKIPVNSEYSSFDIHGIVGGYQGDSPKTVIPSKAGVKFSIRIIPKQSAREVEKIVCEIIKTTTPKKVRTKLKILGKGEAFTVREKSTFLSMACASMKKVFGRRPVLTKSGGSIPIISTIANKLGAEVILMGYGLPDDNLHAPNEKFDLDQFYKGIECNVDFLSRLSKYN